jgi:hypothetical protein
MGTLSLNAYQYKLENIQYDFTSINEFCPEEDTLTLKFDIEVDSMIHLLEREILFLRNHIETLINPKFSNENSMNNEIISIELIESIEEIKRIQEMKHRLEYYLTVMNGSLLE